MDRRNAKKDHCNQWACDLKNGDSLAGKKIFEHFSPKIYRFFIRKSHNREIAEDLTQEVFLKVVNKIDSFDENLGSFSGWVWQIAKNTAKDYYRQKKPLPFSNLADDGLNIADPKNILPQNAELEEILQKVKNLNPEEQNVFNLRYLHNFSYREISRMTNKSEISLRVLMHRVIDKLQKLFRIRSAKRPDLEVEQETIEE